MRAWLLFVLALSAAPSWAAHAYAQFGDIKYPPDFTHFAYVNRCPHTGITLDWVNNQFFSSDNRYVMCATHGAVFEPPTGECIWGPCVGLSLQSLPIEIDEGQIYARLPGAE